MHFKAPGTFCSNHFAAGTVQLRLALTQAASMVTAAANASGATVKPGAGTAVLRWSRSTRAFDRHDTVDLAHAEAGRLVERVVNRQLRLDRVGQGFARPMARQA